jgi:ribonuclease P protein component
MLPKPFRLRRTSEFAAVYAKGRAYSDALVVLHVQALEDRSGTSQVGFSVGKKVGNAVVRNRVKRRLRAILAERVERLPPGHRLVFGVRAKAAEAAFPALVEAVDRVLDRAHLLARSVVDKGDQAP